MAHEHFIGDIFHTTQPYIGHGVNLIPNMNGGIARVMADRWPDLLEAYKEAVTTEELTAGSVFFHPVTREVEGDTVIVNIASQVLDGRNADIGLLESGLMQAIEELKEAGVNSLAVPRIGAGIGGLEWDDARALFELVARDAGDDFLLEIWTHPKDL